MTDLHPIREFTVTEQNILDAKDKFDRRMLAEPPVSHTERLVRWHAFLLRWDSDLKAIGWRRWEVSPV